MELLFGCTEQEQKDESYIHIKSHLSILMFHIIAIFGEINISVYDILYFIIMTIIESNVQIVERIRYS